MSKKSQFLFALLIVLSMILAACGAPAAPAVEATQAPAVEEPAPVATEAPAPVATEAPAAVEEPAEVDFAQVLTAVIAATDPAKGNGAVSAAKLTEELADQPPFLLDVREPAEIEEIGYIEGAVNIPVRELMKNLDKLPGLDDPIVIYCASGHRGGMAYAALKAMGYTNVRNLGGGIGAWRKAELDVVTGSLPPAPEAQGAAIIADQVLFTALDTYFSELPEGFYSVSADKLSEDLAGSESPFLVDVRTPEEVAKDGYIEGSLHLPLSEIMGKLDQLPAKDQPIVVYCASGHRGGIMVFALRNLGYTDVRNLGGGLGAWKAAGLPVAGVLDWQAAWGELLAALPPEQGFYSIKADVLNTALVENPPFLLDVREAAEVEADGYIEGAVHIPTREVLKNLDKLPGLSDPIVVYCASGHRGGIIMAALRQLGYTDVVNLGGGLGAWKKAELPVATGLPPAAEAGTAPAVDEIRLRDLDAFLSGLPDGFLTVKAADLNTELAEAAPIVVDLRPVEDFAGGHIEGAINISITELFTKLDQLPDKAAPVVLVCASGHRGGIGLIALKMIGYTDVRNLGGGMGAWTAAELPVVK
jgi:rhodanese-related sulfurtransferase